MLTHTVTPVLVCEESEKASQAPEQLHATTRTVHEVFLERAAHALEPCCMTSSLVDTDASLGEQMRDLPLAQWTGQMQQHWDEQDEVAANYVAVGDNPPPPEPLHMAVHVIPDVRVRHDGTVAFNIGVQVIPTNCVWRNHLVDPRGSGALMPLISADAATNASLPIYVVFAGDHRGAAQKGRASSIALQVRARGRQAVEFDNANGGLKDDLSLRVNQERILEYLSE